jgi:hypothetical protein
MLYAPEVTLYDPIVILLKPIRPTILFVLAKERNRFAKPLHELINLIGHCSYLPESTYGIAKRSRPNARSSAAGGGTTTDLPPC